MKQVHSGAHCQAAWGCPKPKSGRTLFSLHQWFSGWGQGKTGARRQGAPAPPSPPRPEAAIFHLFHMLGGSETIYFFNCLGHRVSTVICIYLHFFLPHKTMSFTQNYLRSHKTKIICLHKRLRKQSINCIFLGQTTHMTSF